MARSNRTPSDILYYPLAWLTDASLADAMLGDLHELRRRRASGAGVGATVWFWRTALGIIVFTAAVRVRDAWRGAGASGGARGTGGDLHHAFRSFRRNPGFAAGAILLLALGIGANTAVFSVVRAVLLQPLPYADPERLVFMWDGRETRPGNRHGVMTGRHVIDIGRQNTTFESFAAFKYWDGGLEGRIDLLLPDRSERLRGALVTPNFFELLGVRAMAGRLFASTDTEAMPMAVISHGTWRTLFGGEANVIGRQILLTTGGFLRAPAPHLVVGVLPQEFRFTYPGETQVYVLMPWHRIVPNRAVEYAMVGRLEPGVTPGQAQAELTAISHNISRGYGIPPERLAPVLARTAIMVEPMTTHMTSEVRGGLLLLSSVAALVLLIGCVNVGLLLLARTIDRRGELAVRCALGAGPHRLLRMLLIEGVTLAFLGGAAAVTLAAAVQPVVRSLLPAVVPRVDQIGLDGSVLLFAGAITAITALVCGMTPALLVVRRDLLADVRRSGITATADRGLAFWRRFVIGAQVAVVLCLLVGAGLLMHSFWRIQNVPLGFEADDVVTVELRLLHRKYRERGSTAAFQEELLRRVRALPGVQDAGLTTAVPMRGVDFLMRLGPRGGPEKNGNMRSVDPNYFDIMRIPLVYGRTFSTGDTSAAPPVIVVSESFARQFFGEESALGRTLSIDETPEATIVGVVGDARYAQVTTDAYPAVYVPRAQRPNSLICVIARPHPGMKETVAAGMRDVVRGIDPEQPVEGLTTVGEIVSGSTADRRFYAVATGAFATIALLLAITGLFGVVSRSVLERRRELAIRAALGADSRELLRLVLRFGLVPVAAGALAGVCVAYGASRLLESFLFQVTARDQLTYLVAVATVLLVAAVACLGPAARALSVPPMAVLKGD